MKRNRIGNTDVWVTDISFGASGIGNMGRSVTDEEAEEVLLAAWQAGIRYFDTAPHYGRGRSEQRLGRFLRSKNRDDFVLSTKVGRVLFPGEARSEADGFIAPLPNDVRYDYSGDGIEASLDHSLDLLQVASIDIAYVHDIGGYTHGSHNAAYMRDLFETGLDRLRQLKEKGRIRAFGLGVNETQVCLDVLQEADLDVILLAGRLTLLDRQAEEGLTRLCRERNTSLVLGGIFNSGILATGPIDGAWYDYAPAPEDVMARAEVLQKKSEALGMPLASAALQFSRSYPGVASTLLGTAKVSSLAGNLTALERKPPVGFDEAFGLPAAIRPACVSGAN